MINHTNCQQKCVYLHQNQSNCMNRDTAYRLVINLSDAVRGMSHQRHLVQENYEINSLVRERSGNKTASLNMEFVQMTTGWMTSLSPSAGNFVFRKLLSSVKKYNLLWHYTATKSQEKNAIKELVQNKILFRTEVPGIYLINPLKIWRGTVFSAIECTKELLRNDKPHIGMVRDLKPSDKYLLRNSKEQMEFLSGDDFTPNLLEDSEPDYSRDDN